MIYETLSRCPLFRGMGADRIRELVDSDHLSTARYGRGDVVAHRDTAYSGLMIIIEGRAVGRFTYPSGRSLTIEAIEAPQLIAPAFLFGGYNRLPVDVVADSPRVVIATLHRAYLFELMQENVLVLSNFIDIISNRAGVWSKKIYALSFHSLKEKLASYLLDHSSYEVDTVAVPDLPEIAEYFAATRSSLQSVIQGLEKRRIIEASPDTIRILNRRALEEILK